MISTKSTFDTHDIIKSTVEYAHDLTLTTLKHWDFPESFVQLISMQKNNTFDKNTDKEILVLHISEALADIIGFGLKDSQGSIENLEAVQLINVTADSLKKICDETKTKIKKSVDAFN